MVALAGTFLGLPVATSVSARSVPSAPVQRPVVVLRAPEVARAGTPLRAVVRLPSAGHRRVRLRVVTATGVRVLRGRSGRAGVARFAVRIAAPGVVGLQARVPRRGHRRALRSAVRTVRVWPAVTPQLVAHRGRNAVAPENTLPAFTAAVGHASGVETDLRMTSDGHLVLMHDPTLRRTTNVEKVFPERADQPVDSFTFAEVEQLDAGRWFGTQWTGTRVPELADLLPVVASSGLSAHIELKNQTPGFVERVAAVVAPYRGLVDAGRIRFDSADLAGLRLLEQALPTARLALIRTTPPADFATLGVDAVHVLPQYVDGALVARARAAGVGIVARPSNDPATLAGLAPAGTYAVMTDALDLAREVLGPPPAPS